MLKCEWMNLHAWSKHTHTLYPTFCRSTTNVIVTDGFSRRNLYRLTFMEHLKFGVLSSALLLIYGNFALYLLLWP